MNDNSLAIVICQLTSFVISLFTACCAQSETVVYMFYMCMKYNM